MTIYNFERLNVFLVEDNAFVRTVLEDTLKHLGVGRILTCENGAEAIEFLKSMRDNPAMQGRFGFDLVISDLVMSPINGLLLLRWVRGAKESPNRFVPFVMISGAADKEYVEAARDLGVTDFIAKPFSAQSVYRHLLEVIDYPRQFVASHRYFGPDRRRKDSAPPGEERRTTTEDKITYVYSSNRVVKPKTASEVWIFRLPNALKDKVGGMGASSPGEMPTSLLEEAEEKLEKASLDFTEWALNYLGQLSNLCAEALLKPGRRQKQFQDINLLAHELRGQGGTFGYPLITIFGKMLYDCTGEGCREDDSAVEIVKAHIDAMRAVIREKVAGDGGELGRQLLKSLRAAIAKNGQRTTS